MGACSKHGSGEVATSGSACNRKRERHWTCLEHLKPQTHNQWHNFSNKCTPTSTSPSLLIMPLPMGLWRPFSIKPPHPCCLLLNCLFSKISYFNTVSWFLLYVIGIKLYLSWSARVGLRFSNTLWNCFYIFLMY